MYIHNITSTINVPGLESRVLRLPPFLSLLKVFEAENVKRELPITKIRLG